MIYNDTIDIFFNTQCKNHAVSSQEMKRYITSLPLFHEKYSDLIRNVYMKIYDEEPSAEILQFYLKVIKQRDEYDIEKLYDDMSSKLHDQPQDISSSHEIMINDTHDHQANTEGSKREICILQQDNDHLIQFITQSYQNVFQKEPSATMVQKVRDFYSNPVKLVHFMQKNENNLSDAMLSSSLEDIDYRQLQAFEQVFERPMYVHEYFKYVIRGNSKITLNYQEVFEDFMTKFTRLRSIIKNFLNEVLDEYEFVQNYLYDADDSNFFDNFVEDIVQSKKYKENMLAYLAHLYNQIFQESLESRDVEYIFEKVYQQKLSFKDECLNDILMSFKSETENIINHIFEQFSYVLHRSPDVFEINDFVCKYRDLLKSHPIEDVDVITEKALMESLEFHDIVKERIRERKPDILPRMVFSILSRCLENLGEETIQSIEEKIDALTREKDAT